MVFLTRLCKKSKEETITVQEKQMFALHRVKVQIYFFLNGKVAALRFKVSSLPEIHKKKRKAKEGDKHLKRETKIKWNKETERKRYLHRAERSML